MSDKNVIKFREYQIDRPRDSDRVYDPNFRTDTKDPDYVYTKTYLEGKLLILAKLACEYTFNKKLERYNSNPVNGDYNACIVFTKHFLCVCFCREKSTKRMYFVDIDVDLPNSKQDDIKVREIKAFKLNSNGVPCLNLISENYTVGFIMGRSNSNMPYKLPIIGISNKKIFLPKLSFFLEDPHINLYKQNYIFDWRYADYYRTPAIDPKDVDPTLSEKNKIEKAAYDYNCFTENVESGAPFSQYQFRITNT